jgi:hypothetical protein
MVGGFTNGNWGIFLVKNTNGTTEIRIEIGILFLMVGKTTIEFFG